MRRVRPAGESWLDHIGKGVWFAVGFTPVFVIFSALMSLAWLYLVDRAMRDPHVQKEVARQIEQTPPMQELKRLIPPPVIEIGPSRRTPDQEKERECSLAMLRFSETQADVDKQKMYDVCP